MSDEISKVRGLLDAARRKLSDTERSVYAIRAEIAAYERVCAILNNQHAEIDASSDSNRGEGSARRSRGISRTWRKIFLWIGRQTVAPETDDVFKFTEAENLNVNRNTLRSQLSVYTSQGILIRIEGGYSLSSKGTKLLADSHSSQDYEFETETPVENDLKLGATVDDL